MGYTLSNENAVKLWKEGKDKWNAWVGSNRVADVNFSGVDFTKHLDVNSKIIDFSGYIFPKGRVDFTNANFGKGDSQNINRRIGRTSVSFNDANFEDGDVDFEGAIFGTGIKYFQNVNFGEGLTSFKKVNFGDGAVTFNRSRFNKGNTDFSYAVFGKGGARLMNVDFGDGMANFKGTDFGQDQASFSESTFGRGRVFFSHACFNGNRAHMPGIVCNGAFSFEAIKGEVTASFRDARFNNSVSLARTSYAGILDLVGTKLEHQLNLNGLSYQLPRKRNKWFLKKSIEEIDIERLNRLKELAEDSKHHALALKCHADEMRARRWITMGKLGSILDILFSAACNYGQSIARPFICWLFSILFFTFPYVSASKFYDISTKDIWELFVFSVANSVPFLTSARLARSEGLSNYFLDEVLMDVVYPLMMIQGLLSVIFLFLIGLGLRNRFRL